MMKRFDIIDHTADIGIVAYGAELKEAFANAAYAMFTLIADLEDVKQTVSHEVEVDAEDRESLLVRWLNELLYLFDVKRIIFNVFEVTELSDTHLKARVHGEPIDMSRHSLMAGVKAATYHMLEIEKVDGYKAQVIFDV
jgi:SHS2 domain-containing protein